MHFYQNKSFWGAIFFLYAVFFRLFVGFLFASSTLSVRMMQCALGAVDIGIYH